MNEEAAMTVPEPPPPTSIIVGATTPQELVERATEMATALAKVVEDRHLFLKIGTKKHIYVEGWTTLGAMVGVFPSIEWCRPVERGWEARCIVRRLADGRDLSAGEAQCTREEANWRARDDFAIRSMAQTRATSKAMRIPLAWIVALGGYEPTPAEEVDSAAARAPRRPAAAAPENGAPMDDKQRVAIRASLRDLFAKDEKAAFDWMKEMQPKAAQGTEIHLTGLTKVEAGAVLRALNDERDHRQREEP